MLSNAVSHPQAAVCPQFKLRARHCIEIAVADDAKKNSLPLHFRQVFILIIGHMLRLRSLVITSKSFRITNDK